MSNRRELRELGVLQLGAKSVRIIADAHSARLLSGLLSGLPLVEPPPEAEQANWEVYSSSTAAVGEASAQVEFRRDGAEVTVAYDFTTIAEQVMWHLTRTAIDGLGHHLGVHAGVVAHEGHAVMLPAPSGSGKTTLTAGLVASGWDYLSDELAILDGTDGDVVSFARPLCMTPSAIALVPGLADRLAPELVTDQLEKLQVGHDVLRPGSLGSKAAVRTVIFPRYRSGAETVVEPLGQVETLIELLSNAFNLAELGQAGLDILAGLCRVARGYRLVSGDLGEAVAAVEKAAGGVATAAQSVQVGQQPRPG